jgi:hypothetical protein
MALALMPCQAVAACWPDFGLTVTPNADNCCAPLSDILAGLRQTRWSRERAYISTDQKVGGSGPSERASALA